MTAPTPTPTPAPDEPRFVVGYETKHGRVVTTYQRYRTAESAIEAAARHNTETPAARIPNATPEGFRAYRLLPVAVTDLSPTPAQIERGAEQIWSNARARWYYDFALLPLPAEEALSTWSDLPEDAKQFWRDIFLKATEAAAKAK